jgi:hypothetical protein
MVTNGVLVLDMGPLSIVRSLTFNTRPESFVKIIKCLFSVLFRIL